MSQSKDIFQPELAEQQYFNTIDPHDRRDPGPEYLGRFTQGVHHRYRLDTTPDYLCHGPEVAAMIRHTIVDPLFIVVLRNPVDRMFSAVRHMIAKGYVPLRSDPELIVRDALDGVRDDFRLVDYSNYPPALQWWLDTFEPQRFCFLVYEEDIVSGPQALDRCAEFLELQPWTSRLPRPVNVGPRSLASRALARNVPGGRRIGALIDRRDQTTAQRSEVNRMACDRFGPDREAVESMICRDLSVWG